MLDPDYLEQAGEKVASVYRQIESDMLDYLVSKMIEGDISGQRAQTAIHLLAQSSAAPLMEIIVKNSKAIDAAVKLEVTEALRLSDADDLSRIKRGMGIELPAITNRQIAATVAGAKEILERQNLLMAESARNAFLQQSLWAVTQVNTGAMTIEGALHAAVRRLEGDGISLVTYRNTTTGLQSVQNKVDVAVRRHIRTQIAQDGMRLTEVRMDEVGVDLVEVSSHGGSRPSHAKWEGRVYSRNGDKTIDGVRYRDFRTACNWGDVADGIGGANCRHSYAAWFPDMERSYYPNPDHPSGKTNAEVYDLTQKQRAGERAIRQTKRELKGAEILYDKTGSAEALGDAARLKIKLRSQQEKMRGLVGDNPKVLQRSPRREWAGDMPKVKIPKAKTSYATFADLQKKYSTKEQVSLFGSITDVKAWCEFEKQSAAADRKNGRIGLASKKAKEFNSQRIDTEALTKLMMESTTKREQEALRLWTGKSYEQIGKFMRAGQDVSDSIKNAVREIKRALQKVSVHDDVILYRGVSKSAFGSFTGISEWSSHTDRLVGKIVRDKCFLATSPVKGGGFSRDVRLYISAPRGTHGAYIDSISEFGGEHEFLMQAGTEFVIMDIEEVQSEGKTVYDVYLEVKDAKRNS